MSTTAAEIDIRTAGLRGRSRRGEGFSLIETMIAMVVLGIGMLAVAQMIPLALANVSQAGVRTKAVQAAQQRMDNLRSNDFQAAALTAGNYSETQGRYTLNWTITDNTPVQDSKQIVLTATWQTRAGARNATLQTFVTRGD